MVLKMEPTGRLDRSVRNYHSTLHSNPEDSRSNLPRGGSLKTGTGSQWKEKNTVTWFQRILYKNSCILKSIYEYNRINNRQIISTIKITVLECDAVRFGRDEGKFKAKRKSVPLQAWSDPEVSRKLRFPDFMTTAQEGGKVVSLTLRPHLPPGNSPGTHFC
jgi:hypothetical protein